MKKTFQVTATILLATILAVVALVAIPLHIYDGFESSRLSWVRWSRYRFAPGAVVSEDQVVRSGKSALAITVHSGDRFELGLDGNASTERAELMEALGSFRTRAARTSTPSAFTFPMTFHKHRNASFWRSGANCARLAGASPIDPYLRFVMKTVAYR